ncbi:hypothetical protein RRG08_060997 [Elysia crispata]|uniref:Uncharacterized protein n=1 Tax=Elysia crispata TaxID=231223 RepID=A0AAE1E519_9GAST|nr:hypothetical protein RRG08_060997 [Elysia crispata]
MVGLRVKRKFEQNQGVGEGQTKWVYDLKTAGPRSVKQNGQLSRLTAAAHCSSRQRHVVLTHTLPCCSLELLLTRAVGEGGNNSLPLNVFD